MVNSEEILSKCEALLNEWIANPKVGQSPEVAALLKSNKSAIEALRTEMQQDATPSLSETTVVSFMKDHTKAQTLRLTLEIPIVDGAEFDSDIDPERIATLFLVANSGSTPSYAGTWSDFCEGAQILNRIVAKEFELCGFFKRVWNDTVETMKHATFDYEIKEGSTALRFNIVCRGLIDNEFEPGDRVKWLLAKRNRLFRLLIRSGLPESECEWSACQLDQGGGMTGWVQFRERAVIKLRMKDVNSFVQYHAAQVQRMSEWLNSINLIEKTRWSVGKEKYASKSKRFAPYRRQTNPLLIKREAEEYRDFCATHAFLLK